MWKTVKDFPRYEVNECGQIRNNRTNKILKPSIRKDGKASVLLVNGKLKRIKFVHNIVAQAFLPKRKKGDFVQHKDGDMLNNNVTNLFYSTTLNLDKMVMNFGDKIGPSPKQFTIGETNYVGTNATARELKIGLNKLHKLIRGEINESEMYLNRSKKPVIANGLRFDSLADCANHFNITPNAVQYILHKKNKKKYSNLKIKYVEDKYNV